MSVSKRKSVVILFSRLSDYMLNVYKDWVDSTFIELHIFRKDIDQNEAPYKFIDKNQHIHLYDTDKFSYEDLHSIVVKIKPVAILCSGWANRKYLKIIRKIHRSTLTTLTMDTPWIGTFRQYVGLFYSRIFLIPYFKNVWLPGKPQLEYALRLGFKKQQIKTGYYVANSKLFQSVKFDTNKPFPKKIIFVGRYIERKGLKELWKAFIKFKNEKNSEWELICIGTGPLFSERPDHPSIRHLGFLQPQELAKFINKIGGGVFILPSHFEPWGVVVHEFSILGLPLILSDQVKANTQFLTEENGFLVKEISEDCIKEVFSKISMLSNNKLWYMGTESYKLSQIISERTWIDTANKIIEIK